jgi:hypothetical protein
MPQSIEISREAIGLPPDTETDAERLRRSEAFREHDEQKIAAASEYWRTITTEALALILRDPHRRHFLPYVEHSLYSPESPEEALERLLDHLNDADAIFRMRVARVQVISRDYMGDPESDELGPNARECWDQIRLQKAGTHAAAVQLLARTIELTFALDGYASAKYLWRERPEAEAPTPTRSSPAMPTMRAKMQVRSVEGSETQETLKLGCVSSSPFGPSGESEDNTFARYTPFGEATYTINNPALLGQFKQGDTFYVDFTPVGS